MESNVDFEQERTRLTRRAWRVTGGYAVALFVLSAFVVFGEEGVNAFREMSPNEVGDLLAGVAGPVAFIWLVYGYFLQGIAIRQQAEELRQNTHALTLQEKALQAQVEELRQSVSQQIELVQTSRQQLDFERNKHAIEREAERRKIAPIFEFHVTDPDDRSLARKKSHLEQDKILELDFINRGGDATDVALTSNAAEISVHTKPLVSLERDSVGRFLISIQKGHSFAGAFVELRYSDILGTRNINRYILLCKRDSNGYIVYEIELSTQEKQILD